MPPIGEGTINRATALQPALKALTAIKADTLVAMMRNAALGHHVDSQTMRLYRLSKAGRLIQTAPRDLAATIANTPNIAAPNFPQQILTAVSGFDHVKETYVQIGKEAARRDVVVGLVLSASRTFIKEVLIFEKTSHASVPVFKIFGWHQETSGGPWVQD